MRVLVARGVGSTLELAVTDGRGVPVTDPVAVTVPLALVVGAPLAVLLGVPLRVTLAPRPDGEADPVGAMLAVALRVTLPPSATGEGEEEVLMVAVGLTVALPAAAGVAEGDAAVTALQLTAELAEALHPRGVNVVITAAPLQPAPPYSVCVTPLELHVAMALWLAAVLRKHVPTVVVDSVSTEPWHGVERSA